MPVPPEPIKLVVLAVTPKEVESWHVICQEFKEARGEDYAQDTDNNLKEVSAKWSAQGVLEEDVCNWVIYGLPSQDWLTLETQLSQYAQVISEMRAIIDYYKKRLDSDGGYSASTEGEK